MLQKLKGFLLLFVSVVVFNLFISDTNAGALAVTIAHKADVPTPIVLEVNQEELKYKKKPLITGLTAKGTDVLVYVDGIYQGQAIVNREDTSTDNFYFEIVKELPLGGHRVEVQARDRGTYETSRNSKDYSFKVSALPAVPAPTLIFKKPTSSAKPIITGLTIDNSQVHIYIDGVYNGKTDLRSHKSGTANFAYAPFLNLKEGVHKVVAVTEDELGRKSAKSLSISIKVEAPLPAPVIVKATKPQVNPTQPVIAGVVKNDLKVKVYIDDKFVGDAKVKNDDSGTASFAFQPKLKLTSGNHTIKTVAVDYRGKVSEKSDLTNIHVAPVAKPRISNLAVVEEVNVPNINIKDKVVTNNVVKKETLKSQTSNVDSTKNKITEVNATAKVSIAKNTDDNVKVQGFEKDIDEIKKEEKEAKEIAAIIGQGDEEKESTGLINEDNQGLSEVQWNLIIFIFFLIAVVLWIIWVNRELIKEKNLQEEDSDTK